MRMLGRKGDVDKDMVIKAALVGGIILVCAIMFMAWKSGGFDKALATVFEAMRMS